MLSSSVTDSLLRTDRTPLVLIVVGFIALAMVAGVVIASGNIALTGMAIGALFGLMLLSALEVAVWMILVGTLIVCGPILMFAPQLWRVSWGFALLGMFLALAAALAAGTRRHDALKPAPGYVLLAILFMLMVFLSLALPEVQFAEAGPALKRYFQYWGLLFVFAAVPFKMDFIRRLGLFAIGLALLQIPFAVYQRIVLVPTRWNLPNRVVPIDVVAGTFEGTLSGGSSNAVMAMFLCMMLAMIGAAYRDGVLRGRTALLLLVCTMVPLAIGETKLVVVLLPVALLMVYGDLVRKRPALFLIGSVMVSGVILALGWTYLMLQNTDKYNDTVEQRIEQSIEYNFGKEGYNGGVSVNRTTALSFWWQKHGLDEPMPFLLGHGLGSAYQTEDAGQRGHMDRTYNGVAIGLTTASILLWELGLVGTLLYAAVLFFAWSTCRRLVAQSTPGTDRVLCRTLLASVAMIGVMVLHSDYILITPSMQVLTYLTLGLIAWRARAR